MPDYHPFEIYCAYHEAGHAVAQIYYFGRGLKAVTLPRFETNNPFEGYKARNIITLPGDFGRDAAGVERHLLVVLAGAAAADRWAVDNGVKISNRGDQNDRAWAAGLLWTACEAGVNIGNNSLPRLERRIAALFQRPKVWAAVVKTTEPLLELREIRGDVLTCHVKLELGRLLTEAEVALLAAAAGRAADRPR